MKKIHIKRFSTGSMILAGFLSVMFVLLTLQAGFCYGRMENATELYIISEKSARKLQQGSDVLTEQVRLYVMTGDTEYLDAYFEEANVTRSRDTAVDELKEHFAGTQILAELENALGDSQMLMEREYYAMRLASSGFHLSVSALPEEVADMVLSEEDLTLDDEGRLNKARAMVSDNVYEGVKAKITDNVDRCIDDLLNLTRDQRSHYSDIFREMYLLQEIGMAVLIVFLIISSLIVRKLIVQPLVSYNASIEQDQTVPVVGAAELQSLAQTYNRVFEENQATQKIIRHEAEHDALSELLNRGAFNKMLDIYSKGTIPFALIILDIDVFKSINDSRGHTVGDAVIQYTAQKIQAVFRSTDYVFRIGGDEFSVLMQDVSDKMHSIVREKLDALKEAMQTPPAGIPAVTLSAGVAFSDRLNPRGSIFQDADRALYAVKEHGKNGYQFYEG